jgi:hypothetical protein
MNIMAVSRHNGFSKFVPDASVTFARVLLQRNAHGCRCSLRGLACRAALETFVRGIISWIVFFSAGVLCAGSYFYRLHPEHAPETDLPKIRGELEDAMKRAERIKEAWQGQPQAGEKPSQPERQSPPANTPAEHAATQK